jgi:hypothetical protein
MHFRLRSLKSRDISSLHVEMLHAQIPTVALGEINVLPRGLSLSMRAGRDE